MEVSELFAQVNLLACGPVGWGRRVEESRPGIYVITQAHQPCKALAFKPVPSGVQIDMAYEQQRWLEGEPIIYIGKTDMPISKRIGQFYNHQFGNRSPHAGGQILLLLECDLSVYWAPSLTPLKTEKEMLNHFKRRNEKLPFANYDGQRRPRRVQKVPPGL